MLALVAPTLFVNDGAGAWCRGRAAAAAVVAALLFVLRERSARYPLLDLKLVARPLVSSGLAYKAAAGLATAGLGYMVTLQLQLDWGWTPAHAAIGMLPQVVVLIAGGAFVRPFVERVGLERAAWLSAAAVVAGLAVYGLLGRFGYVWVARGARAGGRRDARGRRGRRASTCSVACRRTGPRSARRSSTPPPRSPPASASPSPAPSSRRCSPATSPPRTGARSRPRSSGRPSPIAGLALTAVAAALVGWGFARTRQTANNQPMASRNDAIPEQA